MYAHVCAPYVGVEFRNGVMYVHQCARHARCDGISNVGHTHRTEKSSRYEPETLHSKPNGGLSVENERETKQEKKGRE